MIIIIFVKTFKNVWMLIKKVGIIISRFHLLIVKFITLNKITFLTNYVFSYNNNTYKIVNVPIFII